MPQFQPLSRAFARHFEHRREALPPFGARRYWQLRQLRVPVTAHDAPRQAAFRVVQGRIRLQVEAICAGPQDKRLGHHEHVNDASSELQGERAAAFGVMRRIHAHDRAADRFPVPAVRLRALARLEAAVENRPVKRPDSSGQRLAPNLSGCARAVEAFKQVGAQCNLGRTQPRPGPELHQQLLGRRDIAGSGQRGREQRAPWRVAGQALHERLPETIVIHAIEQAPEGRFT